jgi:hypothetical protein
MASPTDIGGLEGSQAAFGDIHHVAVKVERIEDSERSLGRNAQVDDPSRRDNPGQFIDETFVVTHIGEDGAALDDLKLAVFEREMSGRGRDDHTA